MIAVACKLTSYGVFEEDLYFEKAIEGHTCSAP